MTARSNLGALGFPVLSPTAIRAHEMKNCIATLSAISQLLEREVSPSGRPRLKRMRETTKRLIALVQEDLRAPCDGEGCAPGDALEDLRTRCIDEAIERGIDFLVGGDLVTLLPIPRGELAEALTNLVKNAFEATPRGGRVVVVAMALPHGGFQFSVSDTGEGMTAEQLRNYGKAVRTSKAGGSGVGVVSTRDGLARRGATLLVESRVGRGTRATIRFSRRAGSD